MLLYSKACIFITDGRDTAEFSCINKFRASHDFLCPCGLLDRRSQRFPNALSTLFKLMKTEISRHLYFRLGWFVLVSNLVYKLVSSTSSPFRSFILELLQMLLKSVDVVPSIESIPLFDTSRHSLVPCHRPVVQQLISK
jgi:hypothetical protein